MDEYQTIVNPPATDDRPQATAPVVEPISATPDPVEAPVEPKTETAPVTNQESIVREPKVIFPPENLPALTMSEISVDFIQPNPWQPRRVFNEQALEELSASIKEHGILQPLVVVPLPDGNYQLIVGERRFPPSKTPRHTKDPAVTRAFIDQH